MKSSFALSADRFSRCLLVMYKRQSCWLTVILQYYSSFRVRKKNCAAKTAVETSVDTASPDRPVLSVKMYDVQIPYYPSSPFPVSSASILLSKLPAACPRVHCLILFASPVRITVKSDRRKSCNTCPLWSGPASAAWSKRLCRYTTL